MLSWMVFFGFWYFTGSFWLTLAIFVGWGVFRGLLITFLELRDLFNGLARENARDVGASAQVKQIATRDSTKVS